jgi:hypothetical protein
MIQVRAPYIWTPDIVILNSLDEKTIRNSYENYLLQVKSDGTVRWQFHTISKSFCQIDIMNFPFDEQTCDLRIRSSARGRNSLRLKPRNKRIKIKENIRTEWFIIDSLIEEKTVLISENSAEFTELKFEVRIRRVVTYYVFRIIIPFGMIAMMSLFTFVLAPDSGEKLALDVTVLLSLVIYQQYMSEYIPRSITRIPMLTIWSMSNFFLVFVSCLITVFVLRIYHRSSTYASSSYIVELPIYLRIFFFKYVGRAFCTKFPLRFGKIEDAIVLPHIKPVDRKIVPQVNGCLTLTTNGYPRVQSDAQAHAILATIRCIKKILICKVKRSEQSNMDVSISRKMKIINEEWKQVAIIFDRVLFLLYIVIMSMTLVVFSRVNVIEYVRSSSYGDKSSRFNVNLC